MNSWLWQVTFTAHTQANVSHFLAHTQAGSCLSSVTLDAVASLTQSIKKKKSLCFIVGRKCCPNTSWRGPHLIHSATFDVWCLMAPGHPSDPLLQWMVMKDSVGKLAVRITCLLCVKAKNDHDSVLAFIGFRGMPKKKKSEGLWVHLSAQQHHTTLVCLTMAKHRIAHNRSLGGM